MSNTTFLRNIRALLNLYHYSGLGLLEYLHFIEDIGAEPIMAVWDGKRAVTGRNLGSALYPMLMTYR